MKGLHLQKGPEGVLSRKDLFFIAIGQVIGPSITTMIGLAQMRTGASTWLAYPVAVVVGFFIAFPYLMIANTLRLGGGPYSAIYALMGQRTAGVYILGQIPGIIVGASCPIALGAYINALFPSVNPTLVALVSYTLFYIINMYGVNIFARIQSVMGYLLIACLMLFVIVGGVQIDWELLNVRQENFFSNGAGGFMSAVFMLSYSAYGYWMVMGFGKDAKNARKDLPIAMLLCIPVLFVIYTGTAMVATGILPLDQVAGQTLTTVARTVLPVPVFWVFMFGGIVMALTTTMNGGFGFNSRMYATAVADGWLPAKLAATNKHGVPYLILTMAYIGGMIPIVTGFDVNQITNNVILFSSSMTIVAYIAAFRIPTAYPQQWKSSPLHIPDWAFYTLMGVASIMQCIMLYYSCKSISLQAVIISFAAIAVAVVYALVRNNSGKVNTQPSVWSD